MAPARETRLLNRAECRIDPGSGDSGECRCAGAVLRLPVPTLRLMSANSDLFATMLALCEAGQIGAVIDIAMAPGIGTEADRKVSMDIAGLLTGSRDRLLAERALPLLAQGNAVIAVGALHLIGEGGLVQRFRDAG